MTFEVTHVYRHIMEMEQMMTCVLDEMKAEITTNQAKVDANLKQMKEEIMARLEAMIQNNQYYISASCCIEVSLIVYYRFCL
jgi:transcription initiation factor IIE alpha subunit